MNDLKNLINYNKSIMKKLIEYAEEIKAVGSDDNAYKCLNSIFNQSIISFELLDKYYHIWDKIKYNSVFEEYQTKKEQRERCICITKSFFISSISSIEYHMRLIIDSNETHILKSYINRSKKAFDAFESVYTTLDNDNKAKFKSVRKMLKDLPPCDSISKIIEKSNSKGFVTYEELKEWQFIITLRNITVHNNCIGSKDLSIEIYNKKFEIKKDEMMKGDIYTYLYFIERSIELFYNWAKNNYKLY